MNILFDKINELKKEKDAVILAHYYVEPEIQMIADYVGDSYYLAKIAKETPCNTIVFCGVEFMGDGSVRADAEMLSMVVEALLAIDIKEFKISVGHAGFFNALLAEKVSSKPTSP